MRTKSSVLNFITSFVPWIFLAVLGFLKISLFINVYGAELNGLVQLIGQIYSYIGILEMGFGTSVIFKMYKPFAEKDYDKVAQIFEGSKKIYRKISISMFICGMIFAIIATFTVSSSTLSPLYTFLTVTLFSVEYLVMYFFGLPYQTVLIADQKKYKINIISNLRNIIFRSLELYLIYIKIDYLIVLTLSLTFTIISNYLIIRTAKKTYSWLGTAKKIDTTAKSMTKDVLFHKIGKAVHNGTDVIILGFVNGGLSNVSIYSSFNYIITYLRQILGFVINAPFDSFGNLIAESKDNKDKVYNVYCELFAIAAFISILFSALFYTSANVFVGIWINKSYMISAVAILYFSILLFFEFLARPVNTMIESSGKYKETKWFSFIGSGVNIILSLILVNKYGISGLLFATIVAQLLIINPLYAHYAYKNILNKNIIDYYKKNISYTIILAIVIIFNSFITKNFNLYMKYSYGNWFLSSAILGIFDAIILIIIFVLFVPSFKNVLKRFLNITKKLKRKKNEN